MTSYSTLSLLRPATSIHRSGLNLFHVIVIALSLIMTVSAWQFSKYQIETRKLARFEMMRDRVVGQITERMLKYEDALWAGASMVKSHGGDISFTQWRAFADHLQIDQKYPGINGIGVVHYVSEAGLPDYLDRMNTQRPLFNIHPTHGESHYIPISFIEPEEPNVATVGLDLAFEAKRRTAALASRDSGEARITGPIVLVQDAGHTPGFLFYVPFYRGETPTTLAGRRAHAVGAVYAPFITRKLMAGPLDKHLRGVRFSITDGDETIYDEHVDDGDSLRDLSPMFSETVSIDLYGRSWTLDMRTNLAFRAANTYSQPTLIFLAGLLIECLIIALLLLMTRANNHAVAYADEVTLALRDESKKLTAANAALSGKNKELEQFAYIASHDLKTPIRGIGGLTEMLQDDLEPYFLSDDANPDVAVNLERIRDRVRRMNELTGGIMEFSRIGRFDESSEPVDVPGIVDSLRSDFGLTDDQLQMTGSDIAVSIDTFSFRRVIENLIGNAIKYHEDRDTLKIDVTVQRTGNTIQVSVSDNGPGIAPEYHTKIFEMFQTLRAGNKTDSTGIGLAIVKKAVERHGGRIDVRSTPGEGATFVFGWPVSDGLSSRVDKAA